jgi:hypothetical protein
MVQRDYAQGRETDDVNRVRNRFLNAIKSSLTQTETPIKVMKMDFVYGECEKIYDKDIKDKWEESVTPLDGQQRLTTLYLLHWFAAKKGKVNEADYAFLSRFTYDIRPSSRNFCVHLIGFPPALDKEDISKQIIDQPWFMAEWHNDPTIISMLVMLDAIKEKFNDIENLWDLLTGDEERIIFYFLPLSNNGLSDELYIKMNSRGKKLTMFEHFKAEYEALYDRDTDESNEINHKFDVEWIDLLFPYRDNNDNTTDREFMRYFFYISHILCYQQDKDRSDDEFELIKLLYDSRVSDTNPTPNPKAEDNRNFLKNALDCWYDIFKNGGIDAFFKKYLTDGVYEKGKVATYKSIGEYRGCQNFFNACVKLYNLRTNDFPYGDSLFLYGIIIYLTNKNDKSQEPEFIERLRILRNLIRNSGDEIRKEAMGDLLDEVETLMLYGNIKTGLRHSFNGAQEQEEQDKVKKKAGMSSFEIEMMHKFEDHPLIYGHVSGLGYDHLDLVDTFYDLFSYDYKIIHRAMISIDDYRQEYRGHFFMGNSNSSTWSSLLHPSNRSGFQSTMNVLITLLQKLKGGKTLQDIIDEFVQAQGSAKLYSWRYYFAKYKDMLEGADGELVFGNNNSIITLNKHQFNGKHWDSYLNVIFNIIKGKYSKEVVKLGNYGENLSVLNPISSVASSSNGFIYYQSNSQIDWTVSQNTEGIDTEDRIQKAVNELCKIIIP